MAHHNNFASLKDLKDLFVLNSESPVDERFPTFATLPREEFRLLIGRPTSGVEGFGLINAMADENEIDCKDVPPLEGSIASTARKQEGSFCPYVFMSLDEQLLIAALSSPLTAETARVRTEVMPETVDERMYFVGFETPDEAQDFLWEFSWLDITEDVYFNGHSVLCGEELYEGVV